MTEKPKLKKLQRYTYEELVELDDEQEDLRYKTPKKSPKKKEKLTKEDK